jgi:hypothetical protein
MVEQRPEENTENRSSGDDLIGPQIQQLRLRLTELAELPGGWDELCEFIRAKSAAATSDGYASGSDHDGSSDGANSQSLQHHQPQRHFSFSGTKKKKNPIL